MRPIIFLLLAIISLSCSQTEAKKNLPEGFDFGKTENGVYTNDYFQMKVNFNPEWYISDQQQMAQIAELGNELTAGDDEELGAVLEASQVNIAHLLGISKHEWGAPVDFNPSFIVLAENIKLFSGIKSGKDYLFHVKKLLEVAPVSYLFEKEVFERKIGNETFYVLELKIDNMGEIVTQEYMATIKKGFTLSIIASYANEEDHLEIEKFINSVKI